MNTDLLEADSGYERLFICFLMAAELTSSECGLIHMWTHPPAMGEAATGIFLWATWGLDNSIKGDKFKHIGFSHD